MVDIVLSGIPSYEAVLRKNLMIGSQVKLAQASARASARPRSFEDYMAKLKSFDGWVMVSVSGDTGPMPYDKASGTYSLRENNDYLLEVKITKGIRPPDNLGLVKPVHVEGGRVPVEPVEMAVRAESFYNLGLGDEQVRAFPPNVENRG